MFENALLCHTTCNEDVFFDARGSSDFREFSIPDIVRFAS